MRKDKAVSKTWVRFLGWEGPLEKGRATHFSILAWRIPWTVQSMGSQRVRHDLATEQRQQIPPNEELSCVYNLSQIRAVHSALKL